MCDGHNIHEQSNGTNVPDFGVTRKFFFYYRPHEGDDVPDDIIGSEILAFGAPKEGGGLVVVYKNRFGKNKKLVLGFDETGMGINEIIDL